MAFLKKWKASKTQEVKKEKKHQMNKENSPAGECGRRASGMGPEGSFMVFAFLLPLGSGPHANASISPSSSPLVSL